MDHLTVSRKGGRARSAAKTAANRAKAAAYWKGVRSGSKLAPRHRVKPPSLKVIADMLAPYCRQVGISRLEVFGSMARGEARRGSDVDLLATFARVPGLRFFSMEAEMSALLGTPVHLLTRDSVEAMTNPFRKQSILSDAKPIFHA